MPTNRAVLFLITIHGSKVPPTTHILGRYTSLLATRLYIPLLRDRLFLIRWYSLLSRAAAPNRGISRISWLLVPRQGDNS